MALEELDQDESIDYPEKKDVKTSRQELLTNAKTEPILQGFYPSLKKAGCTLTLVPVSYWY